MAVGAGGDNGSAAPVLQPPTPVPGFPYTVLSGDNYYRIAQRFGVTTSAIFAANHIINPSVLQIGAVLIIPGVDPSTGASLNAPPAPTVSPADLPGAFSYVVKLHDNLARLSVRFGISIARIKLLNNLTSDTIQIGQTLIIAP